MHKKFITIAVLMGICLCTCVSPAGADSVWSVQGGETVVLLDRPQLDRSGIDVTIPDQELIALDDRFDRNVLSFAIDQTASMNLTEANGVISSMPLGGIRHAGSLRLSYTDITVELNGFALLRPKATAFRDSPFSAATRICRVRCF
ncbi:MAG: hypothetical protein IPK83_07850 [Planctomycetes bacterium]|nr:hypothetical protein [Planctomycetota bacterium]